MKQARVLLGAISRTLPDQERMGRSLQGWMVTESWPGLTDEEIAEIEERYGVTLPECHTYCPVDLSGPFLDEGQWVEQQRATLHAAGCEELSVRDDGCYLDDYRNVFGDDGDYRWHTERIRGAIQIDDMGCAMTMWAIIVGPCAGEIRFRDEGTHVPFEPVLDASGCPKTIRTWLNGH